MKELEQFFESLKPIQQIFISAWAWVVVNLSIGWVSTAIGILVMLFHLKIAYYTGKIRRMEAKLKKMQYDKECKGDGK